MVQKHWPVVFASVGIMPMAAFNFAISALAFNAVSHGYGAVFLISGLAVWAAPPAAVWLAIRKMGRANNHEQSPTTPSAAQTVGPDQPHQGFTLLRGPGLLQQRFLRVQLHRSSQPR